MDRSFVVMFLIVFASVGGCRDRNMFYALDSASARIIGPSYPRAAHESADRDQPRSPTACGLPRYVRSDAWANEQFQRMNQLYEAFAYDECLAVAEVLIQYPNVSDRRRASVLVTAGAVLFLKGRYGEARAAFRQAHRLDRDFRINTRYLSPELVRCFESCR